MLEQTQHLLIEDGCWFAMKGTLPTDEMNKIDDKFSVKKTIKLTVPSLNAERHIIQIGRST